MKKLISSAFTVALLLSLPTLATAKGLHGKNNNSQGGEVVTAVTDTTITVSHGGAGKSGGASGGSSEVIAVPPGTPITDESGATVALADLMGKTVQIDEGGAHTAKSILVKKSKKGS